MLTKGMDTSHVGKAFSDYLWFEDEGGNLANCWTSLQRGSALSSSIRGSEKAQVFSGGTQEPAELGTEEGCLSI